MVAVSASGSNRGAAAGSSRRPKPWSTFQLTQTSAPTFTTGPNTMFCANTTRVGSRGTTTRYCVLTPLNDTSITRPGPIALRPGSARGASRCRLSFSGRTPIVTSPAWRWARAFGTTILVPSMSTAMLVAVVPATGPVKRFDWPRKLATKAVLRQLVELLRRTHLLDPALVHHRDGVGHGHGLLLVVGHVHEGEADLVLDRLELELHLAAQLEVERAERLVEQQQGRPVDDRAGERDALLLATGELRGAAAGEVVELDQAQRLVGLRRRIFDLAPAQAEGDVFEDRHVREQRVALEHRVHRALVRLLVGDVLAADQDAAGRRLLEPGHQAQRRGLAAAGRAEQGEERPGRDHQVQVFDRGEPGKPLVIPTSSRSAPASANPAAIRRPAARAGTRR